MHTPPLNLLLAIKVDSRSAVCILTLGTAWGSPTSPMRVIMSLETDDQLRP
jgi:hypothetical protein